MTVPRFVVPGQTYFLTRRCSERRFFLRPDEKTTQILLYCLAEAAKRYGIRLCAWLPMSNHYHAVVEDPEGVLPEFLCHFHKMTARCLNLRWGRSENLWAAEPASAVRLVEPCDVLDKVVYTLANPVKDHLVENALDWPGASSLAALDGRVQEIERPRIFFQKDGEMPGRVQLEAHAPSGWPGGASAWADLVRSRVREVEVAARKERQERGTRVVGSRAIRAAQPTSRPSTVEPPRTLRPHLACRNGERRAKELFALKWFRFAYAKARDRLVAGLEAVFPIGTYKLAREFGAGLPSWLSGTSGQPA